MDLIDRQKAINKFEPWLKVEGYSEGELNMLKAVLYELRVMPSAQPEIIRCKDCKYNVSSHKCLHPESFFLVPDDDFYCGYAERRTDD